ncbi:MAG: hypothetical protein ACD_19C00377G0002 [uncultured bacterium]|nr:MAG: hypothetical protein ACD_19C00377G0002 [uncultured bacterium]
MISVLINAYACSPHTGSELGMAWHWIINLANYCKIFVITEGEFQDRIESELKSLHQKGNICFYYNPVPARIRKICWNQGDWRFYFYYKLWQKKTLRIANEIIKKHKIDIIHQLNMIGFREPGYLWKINTIPYIWGPIGGMANIPLGYLEEENIKQKLFVYLKAIINNYQVKYSKRVVESINRADALIAAVEEVEKTIHKIHNKKAYLINETGCYPGSCSLSSLKKSSSSFKILWVGKFDFRKQLGLALKTIAAIKNLSGIEFHIIGESSKQTTYNYMTMAENLGIHNICIWHGFLSNENVQEHMKNADLLLFTSIMEGTPHVVLEAISNCLPVLCFDTCGQSNSVNDEVGIKIKVSCTTKSVEDFAEKIYMLYNQREKLYSMSKSCLARQIELSWDSKSQQMIAIYQKVLEVFPNR